MHSKQICVSETFVLTWKRDSFFSFFLSNLNVPWDSKSISYFSLTHWTMSAGCGNGSHRLSAESQFLCLMIWKLPFFAASWIRFVCALSYSSEPSCVYICVSMWWVSTCVLNTHTCRGEVGELLALIPFYNNAKSEAACQTLLASGVVWHAQDYSSGKRFYSPLIWSVDVSFC